MDDLERSLRVLLEPAELVCDAQIPDELVDAAEATIRPLCNSWAIEDAPKERPATLVTYFAIRGSERYEFNGLWPQLGVTANSSRAGTAFLRSLHRLNLPTFQEEVAAVKARTYVAPILMHGAFPADVAHRFVERVERELRIGLVNAAEARRRLLRDPEIVHSIRRPASRLLEWAPAYAERLLDAVIDYIEDPTGGALAQLPFHLQQALTTNADRRHGLRRLRPPDVIFEPWTGYGPEVVAPGDGEQWTLIVGPRAELLAGDDRIELSPDAIAMVEGGGRRISIFEHGPAWLFGLDGRMIPAHASTPQRCVVLLPHSSDLRANGTGTIHEVEHGVPLSGDWSAYRSIEVSLVGVTELVVCHADGNRQRWMVAGSATVEIDGDSVVAVSGASGEPVYSAVPKLRVYAASDEPVTVWFDRSDGEHRHDRVGLDANGVLDLSHVVGRLPAAGRLTARLPDGSREARQLTIVPGLTVDTPQTPLGPDDPATVRYRWAGSSGTVTIDITPPAATATLAVDGLEDDAVTVQLPRVQWGLRSDGVGRLDLAPGAIRTDIDELIDQARWLVVRCGRPANVGIGLVVDGVERQRIPAGATRGSGWLHHRSFDLHGLRDTLRAHRESSIRIDVDVDGTRLSAVHCGEMAAVAPRSWSTAPSRRTRGDDGSVWRDVPWLRGHQRGSQRLPGVDEASVDELELRLRLDGDAGAIVTFLRLLGVRVQRWKLTEFPVGASAADWAVLNAVADRLWRTDGERLRLFSGDDLDRRLSSWARTWRDRCRRASLEERNELEQWLIGRVPPVDRLDDWMHRDWLTAALPSSAGPGVQWTPAAVLYACLATAGGDDDAGPVVVAAAYRTPQLLLETVAFMLQACRKGHRFHTPVLAALPDETDELDDGVDLDDGQLTDPVEAGRRESVAVLPSLTLREASIHVDNDVIRVRPTGGYAAPALRLGQCDRAELLVATEIDGDAFVAAVPGDLDGEFTVRFQVGPELVSRIGDGATIELRRTPWTPPPSPEVSRDLDRLGELQTRALVDRVAAAITADRLRDAPIEELFDDERRAGDAVLSFARDRSTEDIDRLAIAIAPTALLFSQLVPPEDARWLAAKSPLLYAVVTTRHRLTWHQLGWPANIDLAPRAAAVEALIGWVRHLAGSVPQVDAPTWRYKMSSQIPRHELLARTIVALERRQVDPSFIDLMVATHRQLTFDHLTPEATRMLLTAQRTNPKATQAAMLAGIAAFTIMNET